MTISTQHLLGVVAALSTGGAQPEEPTAKPPVAFPHPLITEILYAVPSGSDGDANRDGVRHATGDEFVELINPHSRPINLRGYTLTDKDPPGRGQFKFTFPNLEVPPGGVVVVFNGFESRFTGPVGTQTQAPSSRHPDFNNAVVFNADASNGRIAFGNNADWVLLSAPNGSYIQLVHWGNKEDLPPLPSARLVESAPMTSRSSVQRESIAGPFRAHHTIHALPFSPGVFPTP